MKGLLQRIDRPILAWALYDWANSAFVTSVLTALFPLFFKNFWSDEFSVTTSTAQLGFAHAIASAILAFSSPLMGVVADQLSYKKRFLFIVTLMGALSTSLLFVVQAGQWQIAILLFIIGNIGFAASNVFYDSLLCLISRPQDYEKNSALGYSLGYLGGGVLFLLQVIMITNPTLFGLADKIEATRVSFFMVGLWWFIFSVPLFVSIKEPQNSNGLRLGPAIRGSFAKVILTLQAIWKNKNLCYFLIAYFFYIDGLNTMMKMAVDYGVAIGLKSEGLILAILIVQFVSFPATLVMNLVSQKLGAKKILFFCIFIYACTTVWAYFMTSNWEFYGLAVCFAWVQGATQSISRAAYAGLIPADQSGEYFGVYNMLGKFSAIMGPFIMAIMSLTFQNPRLSIFSIFILFVFGALFLRKTQLPS